MRSYGDMNLFFFQMISSFYFSKNHDIFQNQNFKRYLVFKLFNVLYNVPIKDYRSMIMDLENMVAMMIILKC